MWRDMVILLRDGAQSDSRIGHVLDLTGVIHGSLDADTLMANVNKSDDVSGYMISLTIHRALDLGILEGDSVYRVITTATNASNR
jgi:hypothetical protein